MALSSWKTFDFFEVSPVNPPDDESKAFFENNEISCVCSGSENLFLGSYDGIVRILSSSFKILRTFQAHDIGSITHMKQVEGTSLLVTIAVRMELGEFQCSMCIGRHIQRTSLKSVGSGQAGEEDRFTNLPVDTEHSEWPQAVPNICIYSP